MICLANYAPERLRAKSEDWSGCLQGRLAEHHRFVLGEPLEQLAFLQGRIPRLGAEVARRLTAHVRVMERLAGLRCGLASRPAL